jgi:hypothetical protein
MLIDGVIEHLKDAMVKSPLIGITDIHSGTFADSFEPLQFVDLGGAIDTAAGCILFLGKIGVVERWSGFGRRVFSHERDGEFSVPEGSGERGNGTVCDRVRVEIAMKSGNAFLTFSRSKKRKI